MMKKLEILFEKYKFDYVYINPKDIDDMLFEYIPEEALIDFSGLPNYLGTINIQNFNIGVYFDKKIKKGDVVFKFKDASKERKIKLNNINNKN